MTVGRTRLENVEQCSGEEHEPEGERDLDGADVHGGVERKERRDESGRDGAAQDPGRRAKKPKAAAAVAA